MNRISIKKILRESIYKVLNEDFESKPKFIHLPKGGYILDGVGEQSQTVKEYGPWEKRGVLDYHKDSEHDIWDRGYSVSCVRFDNPNGVTIDFDTLEDFIDQLCFVHGSPEELMNGKMCVVRNTIEHVERDEKVGYDKLVPVERACVHFFKGVILFLGITPNGNAKIVFKDGNR